MAVDPVAIDASAGAPSYSGADFRLGLIVPMFAGGGAGLGVRSGVRPSGSGVDLLVQAQASPNMTVKVNVGAIVVQGAISATQGPYTWALDTLTNLTISAAHATLTRIDLICVRIRDAGVDTSGQRDGAVVVIAGTAGGGIPTPPADATYIILSRITVNAAATSIVSGNTADQRTFTAASGGFIQCTSSTRPTATTCPPGQMIYETDTKRWLFSDTATWRLHAGQLLYNKLDSASTSYLSNVSGTQTIFTTPSITLPNTGVGQVYVWEYMWYVLNGAFTTGSCDSNIQISVNGGGYSVHAQSGAVAINTASLRWPIGQRISWSAGNSDTTVSARIQSVVSGGNYDVSDSANNKARLLLWSTGMLASEVV